MRDLDINQVPSGGEEEGEMGSAKVKKRWSGPPRKKLRLTKEYKKETLALQLKLKPRKGEVWFQNRRARVGPLQIFLLVWKAVSCFPCSLLHISFNSWLQSSTLTNNSFFMVSVSSSRICNLL
ncbi:hypothetical protein NE237_011345 [Protea cynaroides]|uniref:Homeobox domain-containing protein n=1 Tax=Protea cynaroides TaxID=273540 RepID=A0A9Q0GUS0_9MAGN|nr:hypothetical protein NE237_011345 [Protea cynaroides]